MELEEMFPQVLRELRETSGKSQETLADESGLDRTYISLLERGKRQPTITTLRKIAQALNMLVSEIFIAVEKQKK